MDKSNYFSIVIGAFIILASLVYTDHPVLAKANIFSGDVIAIRGVVDISSDEHVRYGKGGSDEIVLIEYSDLTCFFCSWIRDTLNDVADVYPQINLVYRHFNAFDRKDSLERSKAAECVARLGGEDVFWNYIDEIYENQTNVNDRFLRSSAISLGVDINDFASCVSSDYAVDLINKQTKDAKKLGAQGTPYLILAKNGVVERTFYALPKEELFNIISGILK